WQENLLGLTYECVDLPVDTSGIDAAGGSGPARVDPHAVRAAAQEPNEVPGLSTEDFQDTLYFLDDTELRRLEHEIALEMERDVWHDVLTSLLDRLEDGSAERQTRIATLFDEMLPSMLAAGAFDRAATMLDELAQILATADTLTGPVRERVQHVFEQ